MNTSHSSRPHATLHLVRRITASLAVSCALLTSAPGSVQAGQLDSGTFTPVINELDGDTLFAFDNLSIPFLRSLKVTMHAPEKYEKNTVLGCGQPGGCRHHPQRLPGARDLKGQGNPHQPCAEIPHQDHLRRLSKRSLPLQCLLRPACQVVFWTGRTGF